MSRVLLIGIGHPYRRDDGVGPAVAEAVAALNLPGVTVLTHHGEGMDLMERWAGFGRVVLVDATVSGAPPGTIGRWDAAEGRLPSGLFPKGSHVIGPAEGIEMARLLGRLPTALLVIGIEGSDFSAGIGLSPPLEAAMADLTALVAGLLAG